MLSLPDGDLYDAVRSVPLEADRMSRHRLESVISRGFSALRAIAETDPRLVFAYSVKTNPADGMLAAARRNGLAAEVIGPEEYALAVRHGFEQIVWNGPYPAARTGCEPAIVFADSLEAFVSNCDGRRSLAGLRVRPLRIDSRFGHSCGGVGRFVDALAATSVAEFGVSFHVRAEDFARRAWRDIVEDVLAFAGAAERASGARCIAFDVGGGRTPQEFDAAVDSGDFTWLAERVGSELSSVRTIVAEPGQEVATPCGIVVAPILEKRAGSIVIAAGYPDLPQCGTFQHRALAVYDDGEIELLGRGDGIILGPTCLEYDIVRRDVRLERLERMTAVIIADAGAYDESMSFNFARGGK